MVYNYTRIYLLKSTRLNIINKITPSLDVLTYHHDVVFCILLLSRLSFVAFIYYIFVTFHGHHKRLSQN